MFDIWSRGWDMAKSLFWSFFFSMSFLRYDKVVISQSLGQKAKKQRCFASLNFKSWRKQSTFTLLIFGLGTEIWTIWKYNPDSLVSSIERVKILQYCQFWSNHFFERCSWFWGAFGMRIQPKHFKNPEFSIWWPTLVCQTLSLNLVMTSLSLWQTSHRGYRLVL